MASQERDADVDLQNARDRVRASLSVSTLTAEQRIAWVQSIRTYGERYWAFSDNARLSPVHCSRAGWDCIGQHLLQCRSCQNKLKVQFSSKLKSKAIDELTEEISSKQLFFRHDKLCPYYGITHATPARVLPHDSFTILTEFRRRHQELTEEFSKFIKSDILRVIQVPDKLSQYDPATVLAICGWQASKAFSNVIECEICARAISRREDLPEPRSAKRSCIESEDSEACEPVFRIGNRVTSRTSSPLPGRDLFGHKTLSAEFAVLSIDPLNDHRAFCPWIRGSSAGIAPGWEICLHAVERENRAAPNHVQNDQIDQSCRNIFKHLRNFSQQNRRQSAPTNNTADQ